MRHFYYNRQWQVLEERVEVSSAIKPDPLAQYVYHPQYVDSIALRDYDADTGGSSVRHYYLQDALFNVTALTDSTGAVVERYSYTPYGEATVLDASFAPVSGNSSAFANELLYTGRRIDPATGLQLNRFRFYHQQLGRWINRDPIGYRAGDMNLYGYVGEMPTYYEDPYGLRTWRNWYNGKQDRSLWGEDFAEEERNRHRYKKETKNHNGDSLEEGLEQAEDQINDFLEDTRDDIIIEVCTLGAAGPLRFADDANDLRKAGKRPPIAKRNRYNSRKKAREAAQKAGKGRKPKHIPDGPQGPRYHPDVPDPKGPTTPHQPTPHDHYYYPRRQR